MAVEDEAGDLVGFVGDEVFDEEGAKGHIGQCVLGSDSLFGGGGGEAGEGVSAAKGRGFGHQFAQAGEVVGDATEGVRECHCG